MKATSHFYCGISGLQLPIPKYKFPPEHQNSSRLQYYATFFNSIEINSTFYKLPLGKTLGKWSESVNDNFRFTLKLWREVTHNKGLQFDDADVIKFLKAADHIGIRKGCLLIQLPHSTNATHIKRLAHLLRLVRTHVHKAWSIAVEFRDDSWYNKDVYKMIRSLNCSVVIHDKSKYPSPFLQDLSDTVYVRFHGPSGDYRGSYSNEFLREYSQYIKQWMSDGKTVYAYFNNTMGEAFNNLLTLKRFVESKQ